MLLAKGGGIAANKLTTRFLAPKEIDRKALAEHLRLHADSFEKELLDENPKDFTDDIPVKKENE